MTDHDPFDDLDDPRLAAALGALAPESGDDPYPAAHRRFVQRRTRRRATTIGAGIATAAAAVVLVAAIGGGPSSVSGVRTVDPAGSSRPTGTSAPAVTSSTTGRGVTPDTSTPTTATVVPGSSTSTPTSGSTAPTTPAPTGPTPTHDETVTGPGGSVRVRIGPTTVVLLSNAPAAGFTANVRAAGPTEVEVRFRTGSRGKDEHRIRLRFDSGGTLQREVE